jgi:hypothetical protein
MGQISTGALGTIAGSTGQSTAGIDAATGATLNSQPNVLGTPGQNLDSVMAGTGAGTTAPKSPWDTFIDGIKNDPTKLFQLTQSLGGLGGLLGGAAGAGQSGSDDNYTPAPINQSVVNQYGNIPGGLLSGSSQLQYQPFHSVSLPQGLLDQRLAQMQWRP